MGNWGKWRALGRPWEAPGGALGLLRESEKNMGVWGANRGTEGYSGRFLGRLRIMGGFPEVKWVVLGGPGNIKRVWESLQVPGCSPFIPPFAQNP